MFSCKFAEHFFLRIPLGSCFCDLIELTLCRSDKNLELFKDISLNSTCVYEGERGEDIISLLPYFLKVPENYRRFQYETFWLFS